MNARRSTASLTLDHVYLAAALALLALRPLLTPIQPHDFWWHLATGRLIMAAGTVPVIDSFSWTRAGTPFVNQGWLAQTLMYGLYQAGGLELLLLAQALVIMLAYGLLLWLCILRTDRLRFSVGVLLLSLPMVFDNWNIRPQSYALPLFAAFLTVLTEYRLGRARRLWLLPLLMALWVNIHGTFVLGLALIGITLVGELLSRRSPEAHQSAERQQFLDARHLTLAAWGLLTALATLLNPRGLGVLAYVRDLLGTSAVTTLVTEWAPPTVRDASGLIFFLFLLVCVVVLAYARRRPDLTDMLLFGSFLWLALGASRNALWFGMVAVPLLATQAATLLPAPTRLVPGTPILNGMLIGLLALLVAAGLPWLKPLLFPADVGALLTQDTPVAAVAALQAETNRPHHLFHSEAYGSYLIWAAPEQPVFIDPRIELYPYEQWADYINLSQAHDVPALLEKYAIDGLLLSKERQAALIAAIRQDAGWQLRYEDRQAAYFLRP